MALIPNDLKDKLLDSLGYMREIVTTLHKIEGHLAVLSGEAQHRAAQPLPKTNPTPGTPGPWWGQTRTY